MPVAIQPARTLEEREACARMMSSTEPWITLKRDYARCVTIVSDPGRELYVAYGDGQVTGFILLNMQGPFPGYIQSVCVSDAARGSGIGSQLVAYAEERIGRVSPNVFLCVSSFNPGAKRLYERLGYELVGTLRDFLVEGLDELLYRKSLGPWDKFRPSA